MCEDKLQALVVTTIHRGVFFGYGVPSGAPTIHLKRARMCLYWPSALRGVMGLGSVGPIKGSRVGPVVQGITVRDVSAVIEVSEQAIKQWEKAPWS